MDWWPKDMERQLRRLAEVPPRIHTAPLPAPGIIRPCAPYPLTTDEPPAWARQPKVWQQGVEIAFGPPPAIPAVLIQREFHPGNVLWRRGVVSGVVDWQAASVGASAIDIGHCRSNLLRFRRDVADRFTHAPVGIGAWCRLPPWADVVTIIGFLDDPLSDWRSEGHVIEQS
jgi:hypothetical protein